MSKFQQKQIDQLTAELEFSAGAFADSTDKWLEMHSALQTDRDEWKRRALEAEEALQKAADIFGRMAQCGAIGTETDPMGYYVPEELLSAIYAPLQNVSQSGKKVTPD